MLFLLIVLIITIDVVAAKKPRCALDRDGVLQCVEPGDPRENEYEPLIQPPPRLASSSSINEDSDSPHKKPHIDRHHQHAAPTDDPSLATCRFTREYAVKGAMKYGDLNKDDHICLAEIDAVKSAVLWPWEKFIDFLNPSDSIIDRCDHDGDGFISLDDFEKSKRTCLRTCAALEQLSQVVLERAERMNLKLDPVECK
jgi:hypothetical protein